MDGVDAALVRLDSRDATPCCVGTHSHSYDEALHRRLAKVVHARGIEFTELCELDTLVGRAFADANNELLRAHGVTPDSVAAIGSHGQTIFHHPDVEDANSLQIGNANIIAELTGIATVADLRRRDIAAGGQGAPLLPALHAKMLFDASTMRGILNLGGIANLTVLDPAKPSTPLGFDTGPANTLMDAWIQSQQPGAAFDRNGNWARSGNINEPLLARWLADPYFARPTPKSTGVDYFNPAWMSRALDGLNIAPVDVQRTLTRLTAQTAADAAVPFSLEEIWVVGGGAHNQLLLEDLALLSNARVASASTLGIDVDYLEAIAFAWFAHCHIEGLSVIPTSTTGARRQTVAGALYPANRAL